MQRSASGSVPRDFRSRARVGLAWALPAAPRGNSSIERTRNMHAAVATHAGVYLRISGSCAGLVAAAGRSDAREPSSRLAAR